MPSRTALWILAWVALSLPFAILIGRVLFRKKPLEHCFGCGAPIESQWVKTLGKTFCTPECIPPRRDREPAEFALIRGGRA